ncbi:MAG TPA: hypothetical protein VMF55_11960 [Solirubrobacterales bacterium]|nr:hypothetical protein [Solirubrobacterales bacterium]
MLRLRGQRNLRRVAAAALVAALSLAVLAGVRTVGDAHAATSCTKHTKRVVTHVRRHGKRKRVVRLRHYWTCAEVPSPAAPAATAPAPAPAPAPEAPAPLPEPEANAIGVIARDKNKQFSFQPSRTVVRSGRLTVQLINEGEDPHTMAIQRIGPDEVGEGEVTEIPATAPKQQSTGTVDVQPGRYRMWCTLYRHAEEGMEIDITVE